MQFKHYNHIYEIHSDHALCLSIGQFDGVHLGHQSIFSTIEHLAQSLQCKTAIWTFSSILPKGNHKKIASSSVQCHWLEHFGIDEVHSLDFTPKIATWSARDFLHKILLDKLNIKGLCLGENARLGYKRECSAKEFLDLAEKEGVKTQLLSLDQLNEKSLSSSLIRQTIESGNLQLAKEQLGHPYWISGRVEAGAQKGRTIGFPTANLSLQSFCHPPLGVYTCKVSIDKNFIWKDAVAYIGKRPTVESNDEQTKLEIYIPGFDGDLYQKELWVEMKNFIRGELKFTSLEELKMQIQKDCLKAESLFNP